MLRPTLTLTRQSLRACAALILSALSAAASVARECETPAYPAETVRRKGALAPGHAAAGELAGSEVHVYEVALAAGQFFRAEVEELGAEVYVALLSPSGETLSQFDTGVGVKEPAECVADAAGVYLLEVHALPKGAGRYAVRAAEARPADARDRRRAEAFRLLAEGIRLNWNRNGADYRGAIAVNLRALAIARELGDDWLAEMSLFAVGYQRFQLGELREAYDLSLEALGLAHGLGHAQHEAEYHNRLGNIAAEWGDYARAAGHYERGLALSRAVGARLREALLLNNLGSTHMRAGDYQKALDNFRLSHRMAREVGDAQLEGITLNNVAQVFMRMNDRPRALEHFRQALAHWRVNKDCWNEALALANVGNLLKALDFDASQRAATDASLGQYRVLHFAAHGLLNSRDPELSGVILSLFDEGGRPVDGFLQLNEIYNLKLSADLVVLSACQTALGKEVRGEGVVGITRGFMYAGAARVAASLWKVDDAGTAELMRLFYEGMFRRGVRPAQALRAAQVEMMGQARWRSPYHWDAFELQGEWR